MYLYIIMMVLIESTKKVLTPEGNNYAQTGYYLTQDYAFINRSSTTNKGKVVVYKKRWYKLE